MFERLSCRRIGRLFGFCSVLVFSITGASGDYFEEERPSFLRKRSGSLWQQLSLGNRSEHRTDANLKTAQRSTCGIPPNPNITDCDRLDLGSCGNACCELELNVDLSTPEAYQKVKDFLVRGGNSSSYAYIDGEDAMSGENPSDDVRDFNSTPPRPYTFILQGSHTTTGRHFVDTLNFNFRPGHGDNTTSMILFSMSKIHGALGDAGQNYKTLIYLINGAGMNREDAHIVHGCGCNEHSCHDSAGSMKASMNPSAGQM